MLTTLRLEDNSAYRILTIIVWRKTVAASRLKKTVSLKHIVQYRG